MHEPFAGRFRLLRTLAAGGMGVVYEALDLDAEGRRVALKVQRDHEPDNARRFWREAEILRALEHPVPVRCHDAGQLADGRVWLALEWLEGEDLHHALGRGPLEPSEALNLVAQVADALGALHARGVVHRDVKPENLFLEGGRPERVRLLDLGIARLVDPQAHGPKTGAVIGTPAYMSPEQARAAEDLDHRTDLWSLGAVLYECLTGEVAWPGTNPLAVMVKVLLEPPPRLAHRRPDLLPGLDVFVARLMAREPSERPATAAEVAETARALVGPTRRHVSGPIDLSTHQQTPGLGIEELRYLTILLIGGLGGAPTLSGEETAAWRARLDQEMRDAQAVPQGLADGSMLVTFEGAGVATDRAARAARLALALHDLAPQVPFALATGALRIGTGPTTLGAVVDAAADALDRASVDRQSGVLVDEHTAGLLSAAFVLSPPETGANAGVRWLLGSSDAGGAARAVLGRPTPFVGRDRELRLLEGFRLEVESRTRARVVKVEGEPGIGKSRLREEWLARVVTVAPGTRVVECSGIERGRPWSAVRRLIEPLLARTGDDGAELVSLLGEARAQEAAVFLHAILGRVAEAEPSAQLEAARSAPGELEARVREVLGAIITAFAQRAPTVLAFEDAQWLDPTTRAWLPWLMERVHGLPVLVLVLTRPSDPTSGDEADEGPTSWSRLEQLASMRLLPLPAPAVSRIAAAVFGATVVPPGLLERAEGNPHYLEELLRAVAAHGEQSLPVSVLAMVHARLERLTPDEMRMLRGASLLGRDFTAHGVRAVLGELPRDLVERALESLCHAEFIVRAGVQWRFASDLVRDAVRATWTPEDRPRAHGRVARWLAVQSSLDPLEVAEHWAQAGEIRLAGPWWARAAEDRLDQNDLAGARRVAERAVEAVERLVPPDGSTRGALLACLGHALGWEGETAAGAERLQAALGLIEAGTVAWFRAVGDVLSMARGAADTEALWAARLQLEARRATIPAARGAAAIALCRAASLAWDRARDTEGDALYDAAAALHSEAPLPSPADAHLARTRAARRWRCGDFGDCVVALVVALDAFHRAGFARQACGVRGNLGAVCIELGLYERAFEELDATAREAASLGLVRLEATAWHNLGHALLRLGRLDEALDAESLAVHHFESRGDAVMAAASRLYLARIHTATGRPAQALVEVGRALPVLEAQAPPLHVLALAIVAEAHLADGRAGEAVGCTEAALTRLAALGGVGEGEMLLRAVDLAARAALGADTTYDERLTAARGALSRRAANLRSESMRVEFLTRVAENAAILALETRTAGDVPAP